MTQEKPIIFNTAVVQAILDGRKTQTRRVIKPMPIFGNYKGRILVDPDHAALPFSFYDRRGHLFICPWSVGDRLWDGIKWTPSTRMPRLRSRINLTVKNIRVERLQEINNDDAQAEGMPFAYPHRHGAEGISRDDMPPDPYAKNHNTGINDCWICAFRILWTGINGKQGFGWDANPWVWVVEFERQT